jgi:hypothetical protein
MNRSTVKDYICPITRIWTWVIFAPNFNFKQEVDNNLHTSDASQIQIQNVILEIMTVNFNVFTEFVTWKCKCPSVQQLLQYEVSKVLSTTTFFEHAWSLQFDYAVAVSFLFLVKPQAGTSHERSVAGTSLCVFTVCEPLNLSNSKTEQGRYRWQILPCSQLWTYQDSRLHKGPPTLKTTYCNW